MYLVITKNKKHLQVHDREIANRLAENIGGTVHCTIKPKVIKVCKRSKYIHVAVFEEEEGLSYARNNKLMYTTDYRMMLIGSFYTLVCGSILLVVSKNDFPEIKRIYERESN